MAAAALPLVLAYMLDTGDDKKMQSKDQWRSAVWLASTCREFREGSTTTRKRAALQWVHTATFSMYRVICALRCLPHPMDEDFYTPRVFAIYGFLMELGVQIKAEHNASVSEDEALERTKTLLPFLLQTRDRLRGAGGALDDERNNYYRRWRVTPRPSAMSYPGRVTLAVEDLEFIMGWRKDRPFRDAHFRPL
jgi:hypothetical protein